MGRAASSVAWSITGGTVALIGPIKRARSTAIERASSSAFREATMGHYRRRRIASISVPLCVAASVGFSGTMRSLHGDDVTPPGPLLSPSESVGPNPMEPYCPPPGADIAPHMLVAPPEHRRETFGERTRFDLSPSHMEKKHSALPLHVLGRAAVLDSHLRLSRNDLAAGSGAMRELPATVLSVRTGRCPPSEVEPELPEIEGPKSNYSPPAVHPEHGSPPAEAPTPASLTPASGHSTSFLNTGGHSTSRGLGATGSARSSLGS